MKVLVETRDRRYKHLVPKIKEIALQLGRFLRLKNAYIEIYLVGDNFMRKNVLSFPAPKGFPRPDIGQKYKYLGEIYLNPDYIKKEHLTINDSRFTIHDKLAYMLIHGLLHLRGYDHKRKSDTIIMQKKEKRVLKLL